MRKYGGINAVALEDVAEAELFSPLPPPQHTLFEIVRNLPFLIIKLFPTTLLLMGIVWGISFLVTGLFG